MEPFDFQWWNESVSLKFIAISLKFNNLNSSCAVARMRKLALFVALICFQVIKRV